MNHVFRLATSIVAYGTFLVVGQLLIADDKQTMLLKTFVEEFISITPGQGQFPATFEMGNDDSDPTETSATSG